MVAAVADPEEQRQKLQAFPWQQKQAEWLLWNCCWWQHSIALGTSAGVDDVVAAVVAATAGDVVPVFAEAVETFVELAELFRSREVEAAAAFPSFSNKRSATLMMIHNCA